MCVVFLIHVDICLFDQKLPIINASDRVSSKSSSDCIVNEVYYTAVVIYITITANKDSEHIYLYKVLINFWITLGRNSKQKSGFIPFN